MAKRPTLEVSEPEGSRFIVDLTEIELTDDELKAVQNKITKAALELARKKAPAAIAKEPYVRIIHVKSTHVRSPKK